jgi:homoserine dehydrogenase
MAEHYPEVFHQLMHKTKGMRADFEYPFSVAGAIPISGTLNEYNTL